MPAKPIIIMEQGQAGPEVILAVEKEMRGGEESPRLTRKHLGWCGRFEAGEWYCKCDRKARFLTTGKKNHNEGRKFHSCPVREPKPGKDPNQKRDPEPCEFFLWADEEDEGKKWTQLNPTTPIKQPPKPPREIRTPNNGSSKKMKEWLSTSKKRALKDTSDEDIQEDEEGKEDGEEYILIDDDDVFYQSNTRNGSPSRKSAKTTRFATPGRSSTKILGNYRDALPTPATRGRDVESIHKARQLTQLQARDASPTPIKLDAAIVLNGADIESSHRKTDLLKRILGHVKADYPDLKGSTEIMIQHEIEQEARRTRAEARGYMKTVARLRMKVDEFEKKAHHFENLAGVLTGGCSLDDEVELSD